MFSRAFALVLAAIVVANLGAAALAIEGSCRECVESAGGEHCQPFCGDCDDCLHCFRPLAFLPAQVLAPELSRDASAMPALEVEREPTSADPRERLVVPRLA